MSRRSLGLLWWMLLAVVLWPGGVSAQVVLKPNGQAAMPLRVKSLTASVTIDGQFAATRQTLLFQNETDQRIEADFLYTLPPNTLVTSFAYWYGDEKVPAKIVEKEEAAAIYQHITTRQHDPALVEMVGKNTFRARIFPVMPNADLKVEMTLVQTLSSDAAGVSFTMPLVIPGSERLDHLAVRLTIHPDPAVTDVLNNYGLPITHDDNGYHLALVEANTHPAQDLHVHLTRSPRPFHAAMCVTPTDAEHGYFALALTPDRLLKAVTVRIGKIHVSEVTALPEALLHSHHVITLVGRYVGQGLATVALNGEADGKRQELVGQVQFGPRPLYAGLAEKLWAAAWMARLSDDPKNRSRVMALSYHAGIPSKYTSWLAVPKEEMARYEEETTEAKLEVLTGRLTTLVAQGKENTPLGERLKLQVNALAKQIGRNPEEYFGQGASDWLHAVTKNVQRKIFNEYRHNPPDMDTIRRLNAQYISLYLRWINRDPDKGKQEAELEVECIGLEARAEKLELRMNVAAAHGDQDTVAVLHKQQDLLLRLADGLHKRIAEQASAESMRSRGVPVPGPPPAQATYSVDAQVSARYGDPLIAVQAPVDAQQVVAVMPSGEVKPLEYNTSTGRWEARFDIPTYATEGDYAITIIIVPQNGERRTLAMHYHVDVTSPQATGRAETVGDGQRTLRLELEGDEDVARVKAVLPWGDMVELEPSSQPHRFFALVPVPADRSNAGSDVTFIVTDRAHNRTMLTVEMAAQQ